MSVERRRSYLWPSSRSEGWLLLAIMLAGLGLRLLVWRWREFYPLGGDENEYFQHALTLLRGEGYRELQFMRPPLYQVFLAVIFQLFDSQVQRVRLAQALISSSTIYLEWLLARQAFGPDRYTQSARLSATALIGLSYTLAANATELLTETLFLFGQTLVLCLVLAAGTKTMSEQRSAIGLAAAGAGVGLLALLRSVALPLLPLMAAWLLFGTRGAWRKIHRTTVVPAAIFLLAGTATIAPWTIRNYLRYGALVVVDTTGAENLWLDNDPAGRDAVKAQLYALGDDRGARQALSTQRGVEVIRDDPGRFMRKVAGEALRLVALEYWDDLRQRPAIWVPPLEVWARLILGDGVWLILALAGSAGFWHLPARLRWLLLPWALYVVATSLIFHVESRYRLPLYPVLALAAGAITAREDVQASGERRRVRPRLSGRHLSLLAPVLILVLLLTHRPYLREGAMLARKHWALWRGDGASALQADPDSALARVVLAKSAVRQCRAGAAAECTRAEELLRAAIDAKREHPYAHLLLGGLLRDQGDADAARAELRYETTSLEDLQRWMVETNGPRGLTRLDIGDGLDLGDIAGFYPASDGFRWTTGRATVWLAMPSGPAELQLRLAAGPDGATTVRLHIPGMEPATIEAGSVWQTYRLRLPEPDTSTLQPIVIETTTVRPRALDPASDDNRPLGVRVDWIEIVDAE